MSHLRAIYCRTFGPMTPVIRARFWSDWSHCGIITPDETVLEASFWHGVVETDIEDFLASCTKWTEKPIECPSPTVGIAWARTQIGKPYDTWGALGLGFNREWQSEEDWFCSEYLEQTVVMAGRQRFSSSTWRIDPQTSFNVI